jgi:hypothetical protein
MRTVCIIDRYDENNIRKPVLDDFSRFKEKVIMINALESVLTRTDKKALKAIIRRHELTIGPKALHRVLEEIITQEIKRVDT